MEITPELMQRLEKLQEKYAAMGQDLNSYLDGLLYSEYLTYWDYIHLDTLLSLQTPKTAFPDEKIFIMYHQITELYFKLSLSELEQITLQDKLSAEFFLNRIRRVNSYFRALTDSFEIMVQGMEKDQFLKFRMSLLPASGFQSGQYRMIEIMCTDFVNLIFKEEREKYRGREITPQVIEEMYGHIYWQAGATELSTGKKTLTLLQFEEKYTATFKALAKQSISKNMWQCYLGLPEADRKREDIREALRLLDVQVNVNWPLAHYKSAVRYLHKDPVDIAATGGTNWQKYLPPRFQKRIFFSELWSEQEKEEWGKGWVKDALGLS